MKHRIRIWNTELNKWLDSDEKIEISPFKDLETSIHIIHFNSGLLDFNDNTIYEGDIVRCFEGNFNAEVIYATNPDISGDNTYIPGFYLWRIGTNEILPFTSRVVVIGNIFENAELL